MYVPGSPITTGCLSMKCQRGQSDHPSRMSWRALSVSTVDSLAFSFSGSLDLAMVTERGHTTHQNTIDDEQAVPGLTLTQWAVADNIQGKPEWVVFSLKKNKTRPTDRPGKKTGGYELKMAFKYVSESQQEPVTIKRDAHRVMLTEWSSPLMPHYRDGRQYRVSRWCLLFVYNK